MIKIILATLLAASLFCCLVAALVSCSKRIEDSHKCETVTLYSTKYTLDTIVIVTEKLWMDELCDAALEQFEKNRTDSWFNDCDHGRLEHMYYIVGKE